MLLLDGLALQADLRLSRAQALLLGPLLLGGCGVKLSLAALLSRLLLTLAVHARLSLGSRPVLLDPLLAFLGGKLVLEVLALDIRLHLLLAEPGLLLEAPRLPGVLTRHQLGLGLGLLQTPLSLEVIASYGCSRGLLCFSDDSAQYAAGRPL